MNTRTINQILQKVSYLGWRWEVVTREAGWLVRGLFERTDRDTGAAGQGNSRWEYLDHNCTEDSIVKTCWVLVMLTVQHEAMEFFLYEGERVFDPHTSVRALIGLQSVFDVAPQDAATFAREHVGTFPAEAALDLPVIITNPPPMSFQEAKVVLYPHIERMGYLEQAMRELDALPVTKAIKSASALHLHKAAQDFAVRKKERARP